MSRWISVLGCGVTGGLVMFAITNAEFGMPDVPLVGAAIDGAALAGRVAARFFGEDGVLGWALAGLGALLATNLGAALASFPVLERAGRFEAAIVPPIFVWGLLAQSPLATVLWLSGMSATHLAARHHSLK